MKHSVKDIAQVVLAGGLILGLTVTCICHKPQAMSDSERRPLAELPAVTVGSVMSGAFMTDFETYTLDQFPARDTWRVVKATVSENIYRQQDNHGLYVVNGSIADTDFPLNTASVDRACSIFASVYNTYLKDSDCRIYASVIPDKNAFLAKESGHLSYDYQALYAQIKSGMPYASYIDIATLLNADNYYATDSHWKQETIIPVAAALCEAMGVSIPSDYDTVTLDTPFYGVYAGQYALNTATDTLCYLTNDTLCTMTVYNAEAQKDIPLYDTAAASGNDPYDLFVGGPLSMVIIENPQATSDKELIVFRDSFGSSIAPLLAQGYRSVTLVDIRYIPHSTLKNHLSFADQDVLFLYNSAVINHSETLK